MNGITLPPPVTLDPETALFLFIVGGIFTVLTFVTYENARTLGASIRALPGAPPLFEQS